MTILVGYPTNRRAKAVLSLAGMLARSSGEDVVVCTAIRDPRVPGITREDTAFRSYVDELADNALAQAREDTPKDVPVQFTRIDARSVPSGLVQAAEQHGASTIAVGSAMGRSSTSPSAASPTGCCTVRRFLSPSPPVVSAPSAARSSG